MAARRFKFTTVKAICSRMTLSPTEMPDFDKPQLHSLSLSTRQAHLSFEARLGRIDRQLGAINSELSEIKYRLTVIDHRLSAFSRE
jgi:hypothetical protein